MIALLANRIDYENVIFDLFYWHSSMVRRLVEWGRMKCLPGCSVVYRKSYRFH